MHAIVWRSPRALAQPAARVINYQHRNFHGTSRTPEASNPDPTETPEASRSHNNDARENATKGEGYNGWSNAANAKQKNGHGNIVGGRLSPARQRNNRNGSVSLQSSETKGNGGLPPVEIPDWFLEANVKLKEDLSPVDDLSPTAVVHLKDPTDGRLIASLPSYRLHDSNRPDRGDDGSRTGSTTPVGNDVFASSIVMAEIAASMSAGLSIPLAGGSQSFPAAKSNLILHCPTDGFDKSLQNTVHILARQLQADVITINAQDIAELVGDYLSDPQEPESRENSWRNLVFDVDEEKSRWQKLSDNAPDDDAAESEMQDAEDSGLPSQKAFTLSNAKHPSGAFFHTVSNAGDIMKLVQSLRSMSRNQAGTPDDSGRSNPYSLLTRSPSSPALQWEDLKLSTILESILETNKTKRQAVDTISPPTVLGSQERCAESLVTASLNETHSDSVVGQELSSAGKFLESLKMGDGSPQFVVENYQYERKEAGDQSRRNDGRLSSTESSPLIVLIEDFKNLNSTFNGARVLQRLEKIIRQKRGEGVPIMIVGTSSHQHHLPENNDDFLSDVVQWQSDMESSLYRTIIVPFGFEGIEKTPLDPPPVGDLMGQHRQDFWAMADCHPDHVVPNSRKLVAMCKRVNGDVTPSSLGKFLADEMPLYWNRLDFNYAHRLCVTARGMRQDVSTEKIHPAQFTLAFALTFWSDKIKESWIHKDRERQNTLLEFAKTKGDSPKRQGLPHSGISTESRLKSLEKTATHHEKRLLPGVIDSRNLTTSFSSVHTSPRTIEALKTLTSLSLSRPDAFTYGVLASSKIPGLLLYGPPGTGKTLLAKAVAKESGASMLEVSGGDIYDMYVGEGEKNVKAMFSLARKLSPCVVFIDEADALFRSRGGERSSTASHREIINQFLREWDGMSDAKESVFIMVATNRPFDLDDAVVRRLPRRILVDLPVQKDREAILRIHLRDEALDRDVDFTDLAQRTPLYSGSDLKNLCVAAALAAVREENELLQQHQQQAAQKTSESHLRNETAIFESQPPQAGGESVKDESVKVFQLPERRTLCKRHVDKAMEEISASISEDMSSLNAMKQFDEKYGDRLGRRGRKAWGFGTKDATQGTEEGARVRK